MPHGEHAGRHVCLHLGRQGKQANVVGNRGAILANGGRHLFLGHLIVINQTAIRLRFFDRVQVLTLQVLDQRELQQLVVRNIAHDDRNLEQTGLLRGTPPTLAGNDLKGVAVQAADDDRLNDTTALDRTGQRVQLGLVHDRARLEPIGGQPVEIHLGGSLPRVRGRRLRDQGTQPSSQRRSCLCHVVCSHDC